MSLTKEKTRMSRNTQRNIVLSFFVAAIVFIAYPLFFTKEKILATPTEDLHIKIQGTEEKNSGSETDENQAVHPILNK